MLILHKIDNDYVLLKEDEPIPPVGHRGYHNYAEGPLVSLKKQLEEFPEHALEPDAIVIDGNGILDDDTIIKYGFKTA